MLVAAGGCSKDNPILINPFPPPPYHLINVRHWEAYAGIRPTYVMPVSD